MHGCSEAEERLKALQEEAFKLSAELRSAGESPSLRRNQSDLLTGCSLTFPGAESSRACLHM